MINKLPTFGVAPSHKTKGASSPNSEAPDLIMASFDEAFHQPWKTDAHFVTYCPVGVPEGTSYPRCNKTVLSQIRSQGYDLMRHTFALDWDTPDHRPWGETFTQDEFEDLLGDTMEAFPLSGTYSCLYYTRSGARLVYVLDEMVPVDESEDMLRWMIYQLRAVGFHCDELCDWTRLLRLPMVNRDGEGTENSDYFQISYDRQARLPVTELGTVGRKDKETAYADIVAYDEPKPGPDVEGLLEVLKDGRVVATEWAKEAKRRLRNRECYDALFNQVPLAARGQRDTTIHKMVGQATSLLYRAAGTTPEHIYALFLAPVEQLPPDPETDWTDILWSSVCRLWAKQEAKVAAEREKQQEQELVLEEARGDILSGMREWCDDPQVHQDDADARLWTERNLIVSSGNSYYLIGDDGYYRGQQYNPHQLIPAIRTHIPDLIPTIVPSKDGKSMVEVSLSSIINRHCTIVDSVAIEPGIDKGYIKNLNKPDARLILPGFALNKNLIPTFDPQVDEWLQQFFGEDYEDGCRWIAYALAFDEGSICAMSISGSQGAGKKMLVRGLSECLRDPALATDKDLVGQYQYGIMRSPFIVVNEGWTSGHGGKSAADRFREVTSGDSFDVHRKHRDPIDVKNPARVIFTANNLDVIKMLAQKRDLSEDDRQALAIRLMHFEIGDRATEWLRSKGGMAYTARPGNMWVSPDAGGEGDFVVAKHFLWLHSQRHELWQPDRRFLVEGHGSKALMFEMQTQTGKAPLVIETILDLINTKDKLRSTAGSHGYVLTDRHEIFILPSTVLTHWRDTLSQKIRGSDLTLGSITSVLGGLSLEQYDNAKVIPGYSEKGRRRWVKLDCLKLLEAADRHGFKCDRLEKIKEGLEAMND